VKALVFAAAVLAAPVAAGAAGAPDAAPPLRTLTFDVNVHVAAVRVAPGEGTTGAGRPAPLGQIVGSRPNGTTPTTGALAAKGSIGVDIVAVTDDAKLVIDVEETAVKRTRPKVRIEVAPDGVVFYDPKNAENLTDEELAIAHWLARGFYGDHPTEPGTAWTVDQSANGFVDVEHYRVVARDAHNVTLEYTQEQKASGNSLFAGSRGGSLVYDTALVVPVRATFQGESRRQIGAAHETLRTSVTLTLIADSFAKRSYPPTVSPSADRYSSASVASPLSVPTTSARFAPLVANAGLPAALSAAFARATSSRSNAARSRITASNALSTRRA